MSEPGVLIIHHFADMGVIQGYMDRNKVNSLLFELIVLSTVPAIPMSTLIEFTH